MATPEQLITLTAKEKEVQALITREIFKALDYLDRHFIKFCDDVDNQHVPIGYIHKSIEIIKEGYTKALNNAS